MTAASTCCVNLCLLLLFEREVLFSNVAQVICIALASQVGGSTDLGHLP